MRKLFHADSNPKLAGGGRGLRRLYMESEEAVDRINRRFGGDGSDMA